MSRLTHDRRRRMGGGTNFTGPLDTYTNLTAVWSVRRLLKSYSGNLIGLRRDSDNAEANFGYDSSGNLDTVAIAAWLGAANGYLHTWYDQSGAGNNLVQAVAGNQALYAASIIGTRPGFKFDGGDDHMTFTNNLVGNNMTVFAVVRWVALPANNQYILSNSTGAADRYCIGYDTAETKVKQLRYTGAYYTGNYEKAVAINTNYVISSTVDLATANSSLYLKGTAGDVGSSGAPVPVNGVVKCVGARTAGADLNLNGYISEMVATSIVSPLAFEDNAGTYFGIAMA